MQINHPKSYTLDLYNDIVRALTMLSRCIGNVVRVTVFVFIGLSPHMTKFKKNKTSSRGDKRILLALRGEKDKLCPFITSGCLQDYSQRMMADRLDYITPAAAAASKTQHHSQTPLQK